MSVWGTVVVRMRTASDHQTTLFRIDNNRHNYTGARNHGLPDKILRKICLGIVLRKSPVNPGLVELAVPSAAGIYFGHDPVQSQIGDIRVSFVVVEPTEVSVVAQLWHRG